jgi:hypothetical protein
MVDEAQWWGRPQKLEPEKAMGTAIGMGKTSKLV